MPAVRGLVFELSIPKYVLARGAGKAFPALHYGRGSCLRLRDDVPSPALPGPGWVRLRPRLAGLCGSDMATVFFKASPQLEPFTSFPAVLGHEVLAEVAEDAPGLPAGRRVAVNPLLPCRLRGFAQPCRACAAGEEQGCLHVAEGCLAPGMMIGYHRDLPGGMGTEMVAHASQLVPLPDAVTDAQGVLVEPLAVGLHAVLRAPPRPGERVLVIGGGPVAFAVLWALRAAGFGNRVTGMAAEAYQEELARALGADETLRAGPAQATAEAVAERTGAKVYRPILGPPALAGGFDLTVDCVGSAQSVGDALRCTRSLGRVVLVGAAGVLKAVDWTTVWRNELTVLGSYVYGVEDFRGRRVHTFEAVRDLLAAREGPDPGVLVTHRFPLERYREAVEANLHRRQHRSVKTVFEL